MWSIHIILDFRHNSSKYHHWEIKLKCNVAWIRRCGEAKIQHLTFLYWFFVAAERMTLSVMIDWGSATNCIVRSDHCKIRLSQENLSRQSKKNAGGARASSIWLIHSSQNKCSHTHINIETHVEITNNWQSSTMKSWSAKLSWALKITCCSVI
jgi:hypothetical protein